MHGSYWKAFVIQVWIGLLVLSDLYAQGNQQLDDLQTRHEGIPTPLTDQPGDTERGRHIVLNRQRGDCVVCHALPLPERRFHGTVGLPLDNVGSRYTAAELRLRLVDPKALNPHSIMPAYHTVEGRHSVLEAYRGKPILTAQEIEDVVAYLLTLRQDAPQASQTPSGPQHETSPYSVEGRRSGYTYLSEEHRQLQDDVFGNPGMLWVERGRELWDQPQGDGQQACASCHGDASTSMRGVRTRYPQFDPRTKKLINLEQRINRCRTEQLRVEAYPYESEALLALSTFVSFQSRGMPLSVDIKGPAAPFFEAGKAFFMRRRGQLDMACSHCHDEYAGQRLRGEVVSQGQTNGFPVYRLSWQTLGSTHRMFAWCNTAIRAQPLAHGADDYVNLELYMAWRGRGLPVETPGVRR
ncbi:sulfur oxidation c-type cytochrome SoxA [Candidatus Poriferisodalis sp.]|uniref:sulfur oxidation c-type cytochrome SoxA n=1 Tax=Candidatus Poriferisodalis sp. TaxID=3101277 RepID=UPI003B51FBD9